MKVIREQISKIHYDFPKWKFLHFLGVPRDAEIIEITIDNVANRVRITCNDKKI